MSRISPIVFVLAFLPAIVFAAPSSFGAAQSLEATSSSPGNLYVAGASVILTAPVAGDFLACGGSVVTAAPILGDAFFLAGSASSRSNVAGDLRIVGGSIDVDQPVGGDLVALGLSVTDTSRAEGSVFIVAANTFLDDGAVGPVVIYGNNVALAGDFDADVTITALGRVTLAPGTKIHGKLTYEAPEKAIIPASATIVGGVAYDSSSYLPDVGTSRTLALISLGFFVVARIFGALLLAGLLAGLFPRFAETIVSRVVEGRLRRILLTTLLGFGVFVATPIVILLLLLTFVGIGLGILLFIVYVLLILLSLLYAGIVCGGLLARRFMKRGIVLWQDGVIGMLVVSLVTIIPFVGIFVLCASAFFSAGILLQLFFSFAFPHDEQIEML